MIKIKEIRRISSNESYKLGDEAYYGGAYVEFSDLIKLYNDR